MWSTAEKFCISWLYQMAGMSLLGTLAGTLGFLAVFGDAAGSDLAEIAEMGAIIGALGGASTSVVPATFISLKAPEAVLTFRERVSTRKSDLDVNLNVKVEALAPYVYFCLLLTLAGVCGAGISHLLFSQTQSVGLEGATQGMATGSALLLAGFFLFKPSYEAFNERFIDSEMSSSPSL